MRFEWDHRKAASNLKKHKVTFDEAATVFADPLALIFDEQDHSAEERREIMIGSSALRRLVIVCFTERSGDTIRIVSARLPTRRERQDHEENTNR